MLNQNRYAMWCSNAGCWSGTAVQAVQPSLPSLQAVLHSASQVPVFLYYDWETSQLILQKTNDNDKSHYVSGTHSMSQDSLWITVVLLCFVCRGPPPSEKQQLKLRREKWRICKGLLSFFLNLRLPLFLFWSEIHSYPSKAKQLSTTSPQRGRDDLNGDQGECVLRHPQHVHEAQGTFHLTQTWA